MKRVNSFENAVKYDFSDKKSGKVVHVLLAYMLHSSKARENHTAFGKYFSAALQNVAKTGSVVPTLVVDGELGLLDIIDVSNLYFPFFTSSIYICEGDFPILV